jgi:hypothetical protein
MATKAEPLIAIGVRVEKKQVEKESMRGNKS